MDVMPYLIAISLALGGGALALFMWSLRAGQYEDLDGASQRILFDDDQPHPRSIDERRREP